MIELRTYHSVEQLKNGMDVTVRAVRQDDKDRFIDAFRNLERESVYTRFFGFKNELTKEDLKTITEVDFENVVALVVTKTEGQDETIIGSGRYIAGDAPGGKRNAEVAFTVVEGYHGLGIASRILRRLIAIARDKGIAMFEADVLPENKAMLAVFGRSGLAMSQSREDGIVHVTLEL